MARSEVLRWLGGRGCQSAGYRGGGAKGSFHHCALWSGSPTDRGYGSKLTSALSQLLVALRLETVRFDYGLHHEAVGVTERSFLAPLGAYIREELW